MKHIFVVNPVAGNGKKQGKLITNIKQAAKTEGADFLIEMSQSYQNSFERVKSMASRAKEKTRFYACGGDGTLNLVVNAIAGTPCEVGCVPIGTGNDFVRNFSDPKSFLSIARQINGEPVLVDCINYKLVGPSGTTKGGKAINMVNIGFDANAAENMSAFKSKPMLSGTLAYILGVFRALNNLQEVSLSIEIDGANVSSGNYLMTAVANGRFSGGGFNGSPLAEIKDGLIDVTLVGMMKRLKFMSAIKVYHEGKHYKDKRLIGLVSSAKGLECKISSTKGEINFSVDGEINKAKTGEFLLEPSSVPFCLPEGCH
ncbi:MAG: hypothetical protein FWG10_14265 [Eubacteriaceae bacterium]|nr:hypothetical protein [Eubacteriaceae bacterium]